MLIKIDLLSVEALDNIHNCIDLLCGKGYIEKKDTLKETYESVIGIYNLERTAPEMWKMIHEHKVQSLFQMEEQSGIQGISLIKPTSINDLTVLNSVIRLMAPEKGGEQPLETWSRYRKDISQWYEEMRKAGLSQEEIDWLSHHSACTDGICESQEGLMSLVQEERLGGNSLTFADKCRKALAKKIGELFVQCEKEFFENAKNKCCSLKLAHYVWDVLLKVQRGYSFNRSHCLAYSLVALQEMNLCYHFPHLFWDCACLITKAGGTDEVDSDNKNSNYNKIASAINKMKDLGVNINLPDINKSSYSFTPDIDKNEIIFGLKGMPTVGEELISRIIENRPYVSVIDFYERVRPKHSAMIILIKSGAFDSLEERRHAMIGYIWYICKKKRVTLQNMAGLLKYKILPMENEDINFACKIYAFNHYLKIRCKNSKTGCYDLDERALNFLDSIDYISNNNVISIKEWDKYYKEVMLIIKTYITENYDKVLDDFNTAIFLEEWNKNATGSMSKWEMQSLCFYYNEHELKNVNCVKYNIANFYDLPEIPIVDKVFKRGDISIPIYKLSMICGTCIAKNKNKGIATILTTNGVVNVRFSKEYFAMFDKQISKKQEDGTKKILEKSWFNRGSMILIQGMRRGDEFVSKKYASSRSHQLYKIINIKNNGDIEITHNRADGIEEEGEE